MDMIACPACGTESKAGTKFCRHCGKEIPASGPMDGQSTIAMGAMTPPPPANDPLKTVVAGMAAVPPRPTAPPAQATVAMGAVTAQPPANDPNKTVVAGMSAVPPASTAPASPDATIAMGAINTAPPPAAKPSLAKPNDPAQNDPLKTVVAGMAAVPPAANPNYGSATVVQSAQTGMPSPNYGDPQGYSQQYPPAQPAPAPSNKGGSKIVYILLALVALGFLAGIGLLIVFLVLGSMNAKTTSPSSPSSPTAPASPTRTPSAPVILDKKLSKLELCSFTSLPTSNTDFNQSTVGTTFAIGVSVIRLKVVGKPDPDDSYTVTWKQGSQTAVTQTIGPGELKSGTSIFLTLYKQSGTPLPSGNYSVELENDGEKAGRIDFTIGSQGSK